MDNCFGEAVYIFTLIRTRELCYHTRLGRVRNTASEVMEPPRPLCSHRHLPGQGEWMGLFCTAGQGPRTGETCAQVRMMNGNRAGGLKWT